MLPKPEIIKINASFLQVLINVTAFVFLIETPLKSVLNNLIIETADDLSSGIEYLKRNNLGKASFFFLEQNKQKTSILGKINSFSTSRNKKKIAKHKNFVSWADNLIETEKKWEDYFSQILANVAVVETFDVALSLNKDFPLFSFVTVDGDYIQSNGIVEAGSVAKLDDSLFGRKQLLENFKNEYPLLEQKLEQLRKTISEKETIIGGDLLRFSMINKKGLTQHFLEEKGLHK